MRVESDWRDELRRVVELMRDLSRYTDPQAAAAMYGERIRSDGLVPRSHYLGVSRRELAPPAYRITRSSRWEREIDPWRERDKLPVFDSGLLGELIYSGEPAVIDDLPSRVRDDDPAAEYLRGFPMLVSTPQFDNGEALNMGVLLIDDPEDFPVSRLPVLAWTTSLWGRSVLNLVLKNRLEEAYAERNKAYEALEREMQIVGEIQRSLLPRDLPEIPGLELSAWYHTSRRAGGDYYDFFPLPGGRWGILVADVSGHGTPSAVMMAITHAIAHTYPGPPQPPAGLLEYVNRVLAEKYMGESGHFVTAFYAVYDPRDGMLRSASAGHPPPSLARGGKVHALACETGLPLGIEPQEVFTESATVLKPGDRLVFYTDGVTEARNPAEEQYGVERLDASLARAGGSAEKTLRTILEDLDQFCAGRPAGDDRTVIVAHRTR